MGRLLGGGVVAEPLDQVLGLAVTDAGVQYFFYLPFFKAFDFHWQGRTG